MLCCVPKSRHLPGLCLLPSRGSYRGQAVQELAFWKQHISFAHPPCPVSMASLTPLRFHNLLTRDVVRNAVHNYSMQAAMETNRQKPHWLTTTNKDKIK